jgi:hypothetical protein
MEENTTTGGGAATSPKLGNKAIITIVAVVVLLLLGGILMKVGKNGGDESPTSLKALMALGVPQQCSFSVKNESAGGTNESTGNVYLSGNKMRVDTETSMTAGGKNTRMSSHMISDGEYYYMWSDTDRTRGIKMKMTEGATKASDGQNQIKPAIDTEAAMSYHCSPKIPNSSLLEIPRDVTFMDTSEMMKGVMPGAGASAGEMGTGMNGGDMKALQCAACDKAGDQKAACQKALGC